MAGALHFKRAELAKEVADELLGVESPSLKKSGLVINPGSGTFLSAQRRTGKSTFMRQDLMPEFIARNIPVIYVDLWTDKTADPARLIHDAIKAELSNQAGMIARAAKAMGLKKFTIAGSFSFDIDEVGTKVTIAEALQELADKHEAKRIVMIIDEAQHALTTEAGQAAMFAMKAARDALNIGQDAPRLLLLCTGSSRSKLGNLVTGKESPFYGARLREFPMLGEDFIVFLVERQKARQPGLSALDMNAAYAAFVTLGHRPEEMINTIMEASFEVENGRDINDLVLTKARERNTSFMDDLTRQFADLTPLQQAVLLRLIEQEENFAAYETEALEAYSVYVGDKEITAASVQNAVDGLVTKEIVWRPKRGGYFIDDPLWSSWLKQRQSMAVPMLRS